MQPDEAAIELVLLVHFYGIRSSGGLCMAAVKKLIDFARKLKLENVAKVLESAYVDDCNSSVGKEAELEEIKQKMPEFMRDHGMPIKALAWSGGETPAELSSVGLINTAGYSWDPKEDRMRIMVPKIFHGEKKKGKFTKDTVFFKNKTTLENLRKFYEGKKITHEVILSKTASLYDPLGFAAPLKVYGSYICRRALIDSAGDPLKEVGEKTRELFIQYTYQVKMLETLSFARNRSSLARSDGDTLVMCTDAGVSASMMIFYIGKQTGHGLELDFVFSIGHLNNDSGVIPRNELDVIERGTRQCERLLDWMTPMIKRKILITDAKVPLMWLRNKMVRTQPYVQTRVHSICKRFQPEEMFYIQSKHNPADLGTKFEKFYEVYKDIGDDSLFRRGPDCLKLGIEEAVRRKQLIPIDKIMPSQIEKESAALEIIKLHQLVITKNRTENLRKSADPPEEIDTETIENAAPCLLTMTDDTIKEEGWLSSKRAT